jgi:hypothetical protein
MYRRVALALMFAFLLVGPGLLAAPAAADAATPPPTATADLDDSNAGDGQTVEGAATLKAFLNIKKILVQVRVTGLAPGSKHAWHIHLGTCETEGPIVINPGKYKDLRANSQGIAYAIALLPDNPPTGGSILTNGVPYYINVHQRGSTDPAGVGGGITCGNLSTNPATVDYTTELTGEAEVDAAGNPNQGDLDGTGSAFVRVGANFVCFSISVSDIALPATAAHIHEAPAGVNGPVRVPLTAPGASGKSSGCVFGVAAGIINGLTTAPANYYVNVHNSAFPAGALRGQLA